MKRIFSTLAAVVLGLTLPVAARADDQSVHLRGTITAVDHDTVSLAGTSGPTTLLLGPDTRVQYVVKTDLSAIKPGMAVGVVAVAAPNGTLHAHAVSIFPVGSTPRLGVSAWDSEPGASMNNATVTTVTDAKVDAVAGHTLTLTLPTGDKPVFVGPDTPIVTSVPADRSALVAGAHVLVLAVKHDDGSLTIRVVNVGQNGLVPPQ